MSMTRLRLVAFAVAASTVVTSGSAGVVPIATIAAAFQAQPPMQQDVNVVSQLGLSGQVLRKDHPVADVRLRLRNLDTGAILDHTTSDKNGHYSFPIPAPGRYVVEAIRDDGAVIAVGDATILTTAAVLGNVILPASNALLAFVIVGAASGLGITAYEISNTTPSSPER
jgi:hypothetical protein